MLMLVQDQPQPQQATSRKILLTENGEIYDQEELGNMVDSILRYDHSDDGYIDWGEYRNFQSYINDLTA